MKPVVFDPGRPTLSPRDGGHMLFSIGALYPGWRQNRIDKLTSILGKDWWAGKKVLELACALGHTGEILQSMGSKVTFTEGRIEYLNDIVKRANGSSVYQIDHDTDWKIEDAFDLVLHWGLLYHLKDWRKDLLTAFEHGPIVSLDTEVVDSDDPNLEVAVKEGGADKALNGIGVRPSQGAIEDFLSKNAKSFTRYDDPDLGKGIPMTYTWKPGSMVNQWKNYYRRFWMVYV